VSPWADAGGQVSNLLLQVIDVIARQREWEGCLFSGDCPEHPGKAMGGRNGNGKGARAGDRMGLVENLAESRTLFPSWALAPPILVTPDLVRVNRAGLAISLFPLISKHGEGG
jgi:hypothetical protein